MYISPLDINVQDKNLNTPLHIAVEKNQAKGAAYLLEHGCKPHLPNTRGLTPIHAAVEFGQPKVLEVSNNYFTLQLILSEIYIQL